MNTAIVFVVIAFLFDGSFESWKIADVAKPITFTPLSSAFERRRQFSG
jgi:hypothetical protein